MVQPKRGVYFINQNNHFRILHTFPYLAITTVGNHRRTAQYSVNLGASPVDDDCPRNFFKFLKFFSCVHMVASFSARAPPQSKYVNPQIKIREIPAPYPAVTPAGRSNQRIAGTFEKRICK